MTLLEQCFRNEDHFDALRLLKAFRMREVVALGTPDQVTARLDHSARFVDALAGALSLPLGRRAAFDPFYGRTGDRAAFQQIVSVKHEYVYQDMAIASVNIHHMFFGERCAVSLPDGGRSPPVASPSASSGDCTPWAPTSTVPGTGPGPP